MTFSQPLPEELTRFTLCACDTPNGCGHAEQVSRLEAELEGLAKRAVHRSSGGEDAEWEIWSEGYSATEQHAPAQLHGRFSGETFKDACAEAACALDWGDYYNAEANTYWACHLFDNEADARKAFG